MEHPSPTSNELADTIKDALKASNLSQRDLADEAGIPLTTLNRKLNGAPLDWDELRAIARVLRRSASGIIAEAEARALVARARDAETRLVS